MGPTGCWLLVVGRRLSVVGCRLLVVGCWLSVVGCRLLFVSCCGFDVVHVEGYLGLRRFHPNVEAGCFL